MVVQLLLVLLCALATAGADRLAQKAESTLVAQEQAAAREAFKSAAPFLDGLVQDVARVTQSLRKADTELVQMTSKKQRTTPVAGASSKTAEVAAPAASASKTILSKGSPSKVESGSKASATKKPFDVQAAVKEMDKLGPKQLPAMLSVVKGMLGAWKDKISDANRHEQSHKRSFEAEIKELEAKKRKFKNDANASIAYEHIEKYWKRQRELSHRQYHTALKLMHSGMDKFKTVMAAMNDAIAGKKPTQAELRAVGALAPPEVVLVQLQRRVREASTWAKGAISILRDAKNPRAGMGTCGASGAVN